MMLIFDHNCMMLSVCGCRSFLLLAGVCSRRAIQVNTWALTWIGGQCSCNRNSLMNTQEYFVRTQNCSNWDEEPRHWAFVLCVCMCAQARWTKTVSPMVSAQWPTPPVIVLKDTLATEKRMERASSSSMMEGRSKLPATGCCCSIIGKHLTYRKQMS